MRTNRSRTLVGALLGASILLALGAAPTAAFADPRSGPIYSSPEAIAYAQAILVKGGYLKPGSYARGTEDEPTLGALRQFQRNHFVRPSGRIDPDTMGLLSSHGPAAEPRASVGGGRESGTPVATATGQAGNADRLGSADRHDRLARTMPVTDSPLTMQIALGALLAAGGAALLLRRFI